MTIDLVEYNPIHSRDDYRALIKEIAKADSVMLYCGAGISYPFTNMNWATLIRAVIQDARKEIEEVSAFRAKESPDRIYRDFVNLIKSSNDLLASASTIVAYLDQNGGPGNNITSDLILRRAIGRAIYPGTRYSRQSFAHSNFQNPPLMEALVALIHSFVSNKKQVRIVTTNYDTYMEESLQNIFVPMSVNDRTPYELIVQSCTGSELPHIESDPSKVPLLYLHGRIPSDSDESSKTSEDTLVFSEIDYHKKRQSTQDILDRASNDMDCILVLGSSLNDPPLKEWIQSNKEKREPTAVIVIQPVFRDLYCHEIDERKRVFSAQMTALRYKAIGVKHYVPTRCYSDIPMVLRDIIMYGTRRTVVPETGGLTYYQIKEWGERVSQNLGKTKIQSMIAELLDNNRKRLIREVRAILGNVSVTVKTELWLRAIEPHIGDPAYLVKATDSTCMTIKGKYRRSESFFRRFPSRSAALRTAQIGEVSFLTLDDLGLSTESSRWQAFYGMPIYTNIETLIGAPTNIDARSLVRVPVGSVIIAIMLKEKDHQFVSLSEREAFSNQIKKLSKQIASSNLEESMNEHLSILTQLLEGLIKNYINIIEG